MLSGLSTAFALQDSEVQPDYPGHLVWSLDTALARVYQEKHNQVQKVTLEYHMELWQTFARWCVEKCNHGTSQPVKDLMKLGLEHTAKLLAPKDAEAAGKIALFLKQTLKNSAFLYRVSVRWGSHVATHPALYPYHAVMQALGKEEQLLLLNKLAAEQYTSPFDSRVDCW